MTLETLTRDGNYYQLCQGQTGSGQDCYVLFIRKAGQSFSGRFVKVTFDNLPEAQNYMNHA